MFLQLNFNSGVSNELASQASYSVGQSLGCVFFLLGYRWAAVYKWHIIEIVWIIIFMLHLLKKDVENLKRDKVTFLLISVKCRTKSQKLNLFWHIKSIKDDQSNHIKKAIYNWKAICFWFYSCFAWNSVHDLKIKIFFAELVYQISFYYFVCKLQKLIDPRVGQYLIIHWGKMAKNLCLVKGAPSRHSKQ